MDRIVKTLPGLKLRLRGDPDEVQRLQPSVVIGWETIIESGFLSGRGPAKLPNSSLKRRIPLTTCTELNLESVKHVWRLFFRESPSGKAFP